MRFVLLLTLLSAPLFAPASALRAMAGRQDEKKEKKNEPVYIALTGGDVYTVTKGVLKNADVLIKDGKIERIGTNLTIPDEAKTYDCRGKRVLPGFIAITSYGLGTSYSGSGAIGDNIDP